MKKSFFISFQFFLFSPVTAAATTSTTPLSGICNGTSLSRTIYLEYTVAEAKKGQRRKEGEGRERKGYIS